MYEVCLIEPNGRLLRSHSAMFPSLVDLDTMFGKEVSHIPVWNKFDGSPAVVFRVKTVAFDQDNPLATFQYLTDMGRMTKYKAFPSYFKGPILAVLFTSVEERDTYEFMMQTEMENR